MTDSAERGEGGRRSRGRGRSGVARLFPSLASLLALAAPLGAQDSDRSHSSGDILLLELTTSTRAHALGGGFWPGGGHAVFHHPALIPTQGFEVTLGRWRGRRDDDPVHGDSRRRARDPRGHDGDDALFTALSTATGWMGGAVTVGMAVLDYDMTEYVGAVGYRRDVAFGIEAGAVAKVVGQAVGGARGRTVAVDMGVSRGLGRVTAALSVQNMGPDLELAGRQRRLPHRVVLGAGTRGRAPVGPLDIGGTVQLSRERSGNIVPGGGVEIAYWPIQRRVFILRVGAVRPADGDAFPLTFGAGFEGDRIRIDYGYSDRDPIAGPHRIGISIR